jgi:hypothetical protein
LFITFTEANVGPLNTLKVLDYSLQFLVFLLELNVLVSKQALVFLLHELHVFLKLLLVRRRKAWLRGAFDKLLILLRMPCAAN